MADFLKSKFVLVVLSITAIVVILAVILANVNKNKDENSVSGSQNNNTETSQPSDSSSSSSEPESSGSDDNTWPSNWPAKPTSTESSSPLPTKDDHDHGDPGSGEEDVPTTLEGPEEGIEDYTDNEYHAKDEEKSIDVAVFPNYKPRMLKFAEAYVKTNQSGENWYKGIEPYVDSKYKELYKGVEPKYFDFPKSGKVTINDEGKNTSGKVQFSISRGDEKVALIIAQYQDDWRVIQIDEATS